MGDVRVRLREVRPETPTIRSFRFDVETPFERRPGQYLMMRLDVQDPRGAFRSFTMASSPTEPYLMVATRVIGRSPFKQALAAMHPGTPINVKAPLGKFTLHEDPTERAVLVAGGIGVTPFRSMVRYATDEGLPMEILLLYGARSEDELAFRGEFDRLAEENPRFRTVYALTRASDAWDGARGRIDGAFLLREAGRLDDAVVYICGRPEFVDALRRATMELGIPLGRVRSEQFPGYAALPTE